jgi:ABC-2 type transport system permease protein
MNSPSNVIHEPGIAVESILSPTHPVYWSIRREIWENRSIYIVPLVAAIVYLVTFIGNTVLLRVRNHGAWLIDPTKHVNTPFEMAAALIMGSAFIVGVFYSLDALYGERRDRSILFWKSMPVSDLTTVMAKVAVPIVILPLFSFVITIVTQTLMLLLSSLVLLGSGISIASAWSHGSVFQFSGILLYHIVTVHGLWYAPMYGWLLFVSASAPRAPFIWAFLPPFLVGGLEMATFNTNHFFQMLLGRLAGPEAPAPHNGGFMSAMTMLTPLQFFIQPGLWFGLAIAAAFIAAAVRLRRSRVPI